MKRDASTLDSAVLSKRAADAATGETLALVVAWAEKEPGRVGEALLVPEEGGIFGRGGRRADDPEERLLLLRQRPGENEWATPIENPFLSRMQLRLSATAEGVHAHNLGKRRMAIDGKEASSGTVAPGGTLEIQHQLLFCCVRRPKIIPAPKHAKRAKRAEFGAADALGIVGESVAAWALRDLIAFTAERNAHVLILGESGSGKELVGQAIHALSARSRRRIVARNAATIPSGLIDAELFGNVANYPNPGMAERAGLIGEADGSSLFLDEIGELSEEVQAHLLRVLDEKGDYQRLGDSRARSSDLRVIAATNRPVGSLKHDIAARLRLRVEVPGLNERREDVPLVARHLLERIAAGDAAIGETFFEVSDGKRGPPRISLNLVRALVSHTFETHVRELDALLWRALSSSQRGVVDLTDHVREALDSPRPTAVSETPRDYTEAEIRAALEKNGGVRERAWRDLGMANRHVLKRLLKKYGIAGDAEPE